MEYRLILPIPRLQFSSYLRRGAFLCNPGVFTCVKCNVSLDLKDLEYDGWLTRGMMNVDQMHEETKEIA